MRITNSLKMFLELLTEVKGIRLTDEILYLSDLFLGTLCRRLFKCKRIHIGYFYRKDITLLIKSRLNSMYLVPKGTDCVQAILPYHEKEELDFLKSVLKPGDVFIDVGSHLGAYTIPAAKLVKPNGLVIAIDPSPISKYLIKSISLNSLNNVIVINKAAYSSKTKVKFEYKPTEAGASRILPINSDSKLYVETDTIDNIVRRYVPQKVIKCLKIDVEGAEIEVLKGASQTLKNVCYIIVEVRKETIEHVIDFLATKDFEIIKLFPYWNEKTQIRNIIFNIIFKNKRICGDKT